MIKCLCDELKWDECFRHYDVVLGYYWPSDHTSEEGSSASRPQIIETTERETVGKAGLLYTSSKS